MVADKMVRTKWYWIKWYGQNGTDRMVADKMVRTKWYWIKWYGQNGTDRMVASFEIDYNSNEIKTHLVAGSHK